MGSTCIAPALAVDNGPLQFTRSRLPGAVACPVAHLSGSSAALTASGPSTEVQELWATGSGIGYWWEERGALLGFAQPHYKAGFGAHRPLSVVVPRIAEALERERRGIIVPRQELQ